MPTSLPYTITNGTTADATQVQGNDEALEAGLNAVENGSGVAQYGLDYDRLGRDAEGLAVGSFSAYSVGDLSIATEGVLVFGSEEWDISNWYNTANGRFTPLVKGIYRLTANLIVSTQIAANVSVTGQIRKNGTAHKSFAHHNVVSSGMFPYLAGSVLIAANGSSDYFDVSIAHGIGSPITVQGGLVSNHFQGELVGIRS